MTSNIPKHIFVADTIRNDIKSGKLVDKLPGERVIAKELGISYMTVRKAIENLVSEGLLLKIANKGTYVNKHGKRKQTFNLGFFLDDQIKDSISSPYYSLVFEELERASIKHGYSLMFFSNVDELSPARLSSKVDGLVVSFFPRIEDKILDIKSYLPVVVIGNSSADKSIPSVILDNFNGIIAAMEHLFALGHERIGFITGLLNSDIGRHRLNGYTSALSRRRLPCDETLIAQGDYSYEGGAAAAQKLLALPDRPTAIVCANDTMALGALKIANEQGLEVPEDLSLIGFDDITVAAQVHPALTTVAAPIKALAEHAVDTLMSLIHGKMPRQTHIALPTTLITRSSCAPASETTAAEAFSGFVEPTDVR
ncbi:MAG: GntR family transcriptional regulator [Desulfuromonadales bacterium]|jgi:LacI family transcriptional regulator